MSICKSCGKEIKFIKTISGQKMPVDANMVYYKADGHKKDTVITPEGETIKAEILAGLTSVIGITLTGYAPHWATCNKPDMFRNNKALKCQEFKPVDKSRKRICPNCLYWRKNKCSIQRALH